MLAKKRKSSVITEKLADDSADLDEMLEDDLNTDFAEKNGLKKIESPLKIEDDDYVDINNNG